MIKNEDSIRRGNASHHHTHIEIHADSKLEYFDVTQGVVWDLSDWDKIQNQFAKVRSATWRCDRPELKALINRFDDQLHRYQNDQTSELEPLDVTEKIDRVPSVGRTRAAELICGMTTKLFSNMAVGTSQIPASDGDWKLYEEIGRSNSIKTGYVSAAGSVIKHVASFSAGFPSGDFYEIAPVDLAEYAVNQAIWCRVVFREGRPIEHQNQEDFFTVHNTVTTTSSA